MTIKQQLDDRELIYDTLQRLVANNCKPYAGNRLMEVGRYALAPRGKMVRGILLMRACEAVGGNSELVIKAAAGTEYGHLASLLHDDLMDRDEIRRNQRTVWHKYGDQSAILAGDFFIFQAYHALAISRQEIDATRVARAVEVLSVACMELALGQSLEAAVTGDRQANLEDYLEVIRLKTGSLFRAAVEVGAILGGSSEEQLAVLRTYGETLGLAFQIIDDLLCYTGRDDVIQKPTMSDVKNRRMTLPILYAFELADESDRQQLEQTFWEEWSEEEVQDRYLEVRKILHRSGSIEQTMAYVRMLRQEAMEHFDLLLDNQARDQLIQAWNTVMFREA